MDFSQVKKWLIGGAEVKKVVRVLDSTVLWQAIQRVLKEWRGLSPLTCTPTVANPFENVRVYGDSVQDGTPTPTAPIEVESVGDKTKNLFNENDEGIVYGRNISASGTESSSSMSSSTYYIKVKPNTDYTIEFISLFSGSVTRYHLYDTNKTWLQQVKTNTSGAPGSIETVKFTTTSDTQYLRFTMRGTSASQIKDGKFQLEEGNTATSYEPYGYKVPVEVSGNLYKDTYLYAPSQCSFMSLKKGIYTMSVANDDSPSKGKAWYVRLYKDGNVVTERGHLTSPQGYMNFSTSSYSYYGLGDNYNTGISFIIDDDYDVQVGKLGADRTVELMVNVGATPLPYQPYTEPTTTNVYLPEPLRKVGEYSDTMSIKGNEVTVVRNVWCDILKDKNWVSHNKSANYHSWKYNELSTPTETKVVAVRGVGYCEITGYYQFVGGTEDRSCWAVGSNMVTKYLVLPNSIATSIEQFLSYIQSKDYNIVYPLATPVTETYTLDTPINAFDDISVIAVDTTTKPSEIYASEYIEE